MPGLAGGAPDGAASGCTFAIGQQLPSVRWNSPLISQRAAGPAAEAGASVSPKKGLADAPGGAGPDRRVGSRGGSKGVGAALTDALPHRGAEGVPEQKVHRRRRRRAAIS